MATYCEVDSHARQQIKTLVCNAAIFCTIFGESDSKPRMCGSGLNVRMRAQLAHGERGRREPPLTSRPERRICSARNLVLVPAVRLRLPGIHLTLTRVRPPANITQPAHATYDEPSEEASL